MTVGNGAVPVGYRIFSKIVHNEAMKQDPPEIYGWRAIALACSAGFGAMLFGMDSSIIGGVVVLDEFKKYVETCFHLRPGPVRGLTTSSL
jgi:hypothetical protein